MNPNERRYAQLLDARMFAKEIEFYAFERVTFLMAHDLRFTPDFFVVLPGPVIEVHEVKGPKVIKRESGQLVDAPFIKEDADAKLRIAAQMYPFAFQVVFFPKALGNWLTKPYPPLGPRSLTLGTADVSALVDLIRRPEPMEIRLHISHQPALLAAPKGHGAYEFSLLRAEPSAKPRGRKLA